MAIEKDGSVSEHEYVRQDVKDEVINPATNTVDIETFQGRPLDLRTILGLVALAVTYEASLFALALPAAILITINNSVGPLSDIVWMPTSYALANAVTTTVADRCSDIFGRRNFFLVGNTFGIVGCGIACSASNVSTIIICSSFLGLAAGLQQVAFAAANEIVPKKNRGQVLALMTLVSLPGSSFGAPISLLLFSGGLTTFLIGIGFGGNPYPWTSVIVLGPTIVGGISVFVAFPVWEKFGSGSITKLCPPHLTTNVRGVVVHFAVSFAGGMALTSTAFLWPQQVQRLFTTVPESVGWYGVATNGGATVGVIAAGYSFSTFRRTRYQYIFVVIMMTFFLGLNATANQNTPVRATVLVSLASFMIGAINCMSILIAQLCARDEDIGIATGLVNSIRSTGGAIGVAIYSSILTNMVNGTLDPHVSRAIVRAGLSTLSVTEFLTALQHDAFDGVRGVTPSIISAGLDAQREVYANAFRLVYLVTLAFGGLAIICVVFVANADKYMTGQVNTRLKKPAFLEKGKDTSSRETAIVA